MTNVQADDTRFLDFFAEKQKECQEGKRYSCYSLGGIYEDGLGGVKKDRQKAKQAYQRANLLHQKACDEGN